MENIQKEEGKKVLKHSQSQNLRNAGENQSNVMITIGDWSGVMYTYDEF